MNRISTTILFPFQKRLSIRLVVFSLFLSGTALSQTTTQTYTSPGANTFSVPTGINKVTVKAWGGGGGGGGADSNDTENRAGGGGGGGSFVLNNNVTVTPGVDITVTVGAGGTPGTNPTVGGTGGNSTFASTIPVNAPGGVGGTSGLPANRTGAGGAGGAGTFNGGFGAEAPPPGLINATGSGGGGGAGGETGVGGNASGTTAGTGGTGGGGAGGAGLASAGNGNPGNIPGGGGSGGWDNLGDTDRTGGAGARGEVIVSYTQATAAITRLTPAGALTNATSVTFRVTFSASVTGIDVTDFVKTGSANGTVSSVANIAATTVDVIVTGVSGTGNLGLNFAGGTDIINADGNVVNLTPTTDEEYNIDTTQPTVVLTDDHPDGIVRDADNVVITATITEVNGLAGTPTITIGTVVTAQAMTGGPLIWTYNWNVPAGDENPANVTVTVNDVVGNPAAAPTGQTSYDIDNTAPIITTVTSDATAAGTLKVGDQIIFTADIQITEPGLTIAPTSYNGGTLTWSTSNGGDTYTATYTVTNGHTDQLSALQLTGVTATDGAGNTGGAVDGADVVKLIDANNPPAFTTGAVTTVTTPVVTGFWNASNTALNITIPIPGNVGGQFSLVGGSLQIEGRVGANPFVPLGSAATIPTAGVNQFVNITDAQFEALTGFANGQTAQLRAVITDVAGNSTTGGTSATNIFIDQLAPTSQTVGSLITTGGRVVALYWNATNTGLNVVVPLQNSDATLDNGSIQLQLKTTSGSFTNISGTGLSTITNGHRVAGTKTISVTAANLEATPGFAEGLSPGGTGETQFIQIRAIATDAAGNITNFTQSATELDVDQTPPNVSFINFYENSGLGSGDGSHEVILLRLTEAATLADGVTPLSTNSIAPAPGFYVNGNMQTGDSRYESDGGANAVDANIVNDRIVYLESSANTSGWGTSTPVVYRQQTSFPGTGNFIRDAAGNELVAFSTNPAVGSTTTLNSASNGISPSPLATSTTTQVVFAFRLTATTTLNMTSLSISTSNNANGILSNFRLFSNSGADNFGGATNLGLAPTITPTSIDFGLPGNTLTVPLSTTPRYFYLVADVAASFPVSNPTLQFSLSASGFTVSSGARTGTSQTGTNYSFTDATSPNVVSITLPSANPNTSGSVDFTVTFDEFVAVANDLDFQVFGTAIGGSEIVSSNLVNNVVTVTVSNISKEGTLGLNVVTANGSIEDLAGNPLAAGLNQPATYQVYVPQPAADVTPFTIATTTTTSMALTWTDVISYPIPAGYLISVERNPATAPAPVDGTPIGDQTDLVTNTIGYLNVSQGVGSVPINTFTLLSGQNYTFKIYPYTNSGVNINYKTNSPTSVSGATPTGAFNEILASGTFGIVTNVPSTQTAFLPFIFSGGNANLFVQIQEDFFNPAGDNAKTLFNQLTITAGPDNQVPNWNEVIAEAQLYGYTNLSGPPQEVTSITTTTINPNSIVFSGIPTGDDALGEIDDNEVKYYQLYIRLRAPLDNTNGIRAIIDNLRFQFVINVNTAFTFATGSSTFQAGQLATSAVTRNTVTVQATELHFVQQPTNALIGNAMAPAVTVEATDIYGNRDKDRTGDVNITSTGTLTGIVNAPLATGLATAAVAHSNKGAGLTLTGSQVGLTNTPVSNAFAITSSNEADIILDAGFVEPSNILYTAYQATNIGVDGPGIDVARFIVRDGGADLTDPDNATTKLKDITFTVSNVSALRKIALIDNFGLELAELPATSPITFSNLNGGLGYIVNDNNTRVFTVRVSFKNTPADITDNNQFQFTITNATTVTASSSDFAVADAGGATSSIAGDENRIEVRATKYVFTTPPTASVFANVPFSPAPLVLEARDVFDALDLDYNGLASITNAGSIPMTDANNTSLTTINKAFASGELTFENDFRYDIRGNGNGTLTISGPPIVPPPAIISVTSAPVAVLVSSASDIIEETFAYPDNITYINYQATNIDLASPGDEIEVAQFRIRDGGGTSDADLTGTELTNIQFTLTNSTFIKRLAIYNGTTELGEVAVTGPNVSFGPFSATANDGSFLTLRLFASFNTVITDNQQITFTVASATANPNKSIFTTGNAGGATTNLVNANDNKMEVVATQLHFTTPPVSPAIASLNSPFAATVQARDVNNNLDLDFTAGSSTITALTNATSATIFSTPAVVGSTFTAGVYNFPSDFQFITGNNNDDVTLSMTAGSISTVPFPAPFTPQIILQASFESSIVPDPTFITPTAINYISYQEASNIQNSGSSYELLRTLLVDGSRGPGFTYGGQPLNTVTNSGDGIADSDSDGAPTTLTSLTLRIYNPSNLRRIALYGNGVEIPGTELDVTAIGAITPTTPFYDFVWNGSPLLIAPDNSLSVLSARVSFRNTAPEVTDQDDIQFQLIAATLGTGSKFFNGNPTDSGIGIVGNPGPFIGGKTQPATPGSLGKIDVVATSLDFVTQGSLYAGTSEPVGLTYAAAGLPTTSAAIVRARDLFENIDLDFDFPVSAISITTAEGETLTSPAPFIDGLLNLDGLRYSLVGDGTLQIIVNGVDSANPPPANTSAIPGSLVNVVNVTATLATNGVLSSPNIKGGSLNSVLFGVTFTPDNNSQTTAEPSLQKFIFTFDKPYESNPGGVSTQVFKNFNVTESTQGTYAGSTTVTLSGATITKGATPATASLGAGYFDLIIVDWGANPPRSLYDPLTGSAIPRSYFLVADVDATANISTPTLQPKLIDAGWNTPNDNDIVTTKGTAIADDNADPNIISGVVNGNVYQFASTRPPVLLASGSVPFSGQLNVNPGITFIDLAFDVPVVSLDGKAELFDRGTNTKVADLIARAPGNYTLSGLVTSTVNPIRFDIVFLPGFAFQPDGVYYVVLEKGTFDNSTKVGKGISDSGLNYYGGISSNGIYFFKISSPNPPALFGAVSTFNNTSIGTFSTTFDQAGTAHYLVLTTGSPAPTTPQILNPGTYGIPANVRASGSYTINQVNTAQTVTFPASLALNTTYDVWIFARNNAQPTPIPVTGPPYGGSPSFAIGGTGPTLKISVPSVANINNQPVYSLCPDSYVNLTAPIIIGETNNSAFSSAGQQDFFILLPTGYQFDGVNKPTVQLNGSDFTSPATVDFINNTLVRIAYTNNGSSSRDNIVITNLRIRGVSGSNPGSIVRFAGTNTLGTNTTLASISLFPSNIQKFINSYAIQNTFGSLTTSNSVTAIPDNYDDTDPFLPPGAIRLIPQITPANDYGASFFSGTGVTDDKLTLSAVSLNTAFDITMTRNDPNGCLSENSVQYLVYDHRSPISPKLGTAENGTKQAIYNPNFPSSAATPVFGSGAGPTSPTRINFDDLAGYNLIQLDAALPANNSSQIMSVANGWQPIVNGIPVLVHSIGTTNIPSLAVNNTAYREYQWDYSKVLNATSGGVTVDPYDNFRSSLISGNTFWRGGSLGKIEFTGTFQSTADFTVIVPFRQNVELFVPAIPIIEIGSSNQASFDPTDGTLNTLDGLTPAQHIKSILYTNPNGYQGTPIFCEANGSITLTGSPNATPGTSTGTFGVYDYKGFNFANNTGTALATSSPTGPFTDNGNGTATLNPADVTIKNGFENILITYTYQENNSPAIGIGYLVIRISPNPVPNFTTSLLCEDIDVQFTDATGGVAGAAGVSITEWIWDFSDPNSANNSATVQNPIHRYNDFGIYPTVSLSAETNYGCRSVTPAVKSLNVGGTPFVAFNLTGVSTADVFSFTSSSTTSPNDPLASLNWAFGNTQNGIGSPATTNYTTPGKFNVNLLVTSQIGCTNNLTKQIVVLDRSIPTDLVAYEENFESSGGNWQTLELNASTTASSWAAGTPTTSVIQLDPALNGTGIWKTNLTGSYNAREISALYSPSFDLSQLDRPMISLNTFRQLAAGEGVVLEYSIDNKNVADSTKTWNVLGQLISGNFTGVGWYNGIGLPSQPGNQTTGYGWTGPQPNWIESKHVLDTVLNQSQVVLRFALATQTNTPTLDGFAIDNVRVGNRTRTILVENFKNAGRSAAIELSESNYLKNFKNGAVGTKLVKINYHVGFPQADPFNQDNPADPSSRALYYNIASTPLARLDGGNAPGAASQPFSQWGDAWYDEQTLKLANARITPSPVVNIDGSISIDVNVEAISLDLPANTILHVAVVEKSVTSLPTAKSALVKSGETEFEFVLKKLLPSGAGTVFGQQLAAGNSRNFTGLTWTPEPTRMYPTTDDLAVIAFVQNDVTKEVFQAEIVDVGSDPPVVTGLGDIAPTSIEVYPNPANKEFVIKLPAPTMQFISVDLIDQVGKTVQGASFSIGEREMKLNIEDYAAGIYILQLRDSKGSLIRKKLMIAH